MQLPEWQRYVKPNSNEKILEQQLPCVLDLKKGRVICQSNSLHQQLTPIPALTSQW